MKLRPDQQRVKTLISDTITLLCKNGLNYDSEFCVEALIGITLDKSQVFLVNINETITKGNRNNHESNSSLKHRKRKVSEDRARFESLPNGVHNGENGISARKSPRTNDVTQTPASNNLLGDISINKLPITIVPDNETSTSKSGHPSTKTEEASVSEVFDLSLKPSRDSRESEPSSLHIISPDPNENDSQNHLVLTTDSGDDENNRSAHENGDSGNSREAYEPIGVGQPVWPGPEPTMSFAAAPDNLKPSSLAANQESFNQSQEPRNKRKKSRPIKLENEKVKVAHTPKPVRDGDKSPLPLFAAPHLMQTALGDYPVFLPTTAIQGGLNGDPLIPEPQSLPPDFMSPDYAAFHLFSPTGAISARASPGPIASTLATGSSVGGSLSSSFPKREEFTCSMCSKTFRSKEGWKIHMERHEGKSRYQCPHCSRGFMAQTHLKAHISEHTNELPWPCDQCPKKFKYLFTLKKHRLDQHSK